MLQINNNKINSENKDGKINLVGSTLLGSTTISLDANLEEGGHISLLNKNLKLNDGASLYLPNYSSSTTIVGCPEYEAFHFLNLQVTKLITETPIYNVSSMNSRTVTWTGHNGEPEIYQYIDGETNTAITSNTDRLFLIRLEIEQDGSGEYRYYLAQPHLWETPGWISCASITTSDNNSSSSTVKNEIHLMVRKDWVSGNYRYTFRILINTKTEEKDSIFLKFAAWPLPIST